MKNDRLLAFALFAILAGGCASKSPYDVSAAEVQKRRGNLPPLKPGFAAASGIPEKLYKKGEIMPDGKVAPEDVMVADQVKQFKKGDVLPDGRIAEGDRQLRMMLVRSKK